jgi:hypothetical protein
MYFVRPTAQQLPGEYLEFQMIGEGTAPGDFHTDFQEQYYSPPDTESTGLRPSVSNSGALYGFLPREGWNTVKTPPGQWHSCKIVARAGTVQHWLNGVKVLEYKPSELTNQKFPYLDPTSSLRNYTVTPWVRFVTKSIVPTYYPYPESVKALTTGAIRFQHHGERMGWRNIMIKDFTRDGNNAVAKPLFDIMY